MKGLGIDCVDIKKLRGRKLTAKHPFMKHFSPRETEYCFSYKDPVPHIAGIFAAKEAVIKALGSKESFLGKIEIGHDKDGAPIVVQRGKKSNILVSITHSDSLALAVAIVR